MPVIPWRSYQAPKDSEEYVVLATRYTLAQHRMVPVLMKLTRAIQAQLHDAEGLVGYGMDARVKTKTFLTLSVWETRDEMQAFAGAVPHLDVVTKLREHLEASTVTSWETDGDSLDTSWKHAEHKLGEATHGP